MQGPIHMNIIVVVNIPNSKSKLKLSQTFSSCSISLHINALLIINQ